ncbi:unnamed protein product [Ilex paraguariensis]|uniref:Pentatricopeptide repeat-containing protein n=1 Tax=Ilex paraguariensis TaxID=185542 RepID=A0ABC8R408_9AQUA
MVLTLEMSSTMALTWRFPNYKHNYRNTTSKTLLLTRPSKPSKTLIIVSCSSTNPSAAFHLKKRSQHQPSPCPSAKPHSNSKETGSALETSHQIQRLKRTLLQKLRHRDSDPLQILKYDGDWSKEQFWAVVRFLKQTSRTKEVLQVFDSWKKKEKSRINEFNYEKIIGLLVEEGLIEEAVVGFEEMKSHGLKPSLDIYNSVIHGFARKGRFEDALCYMKGMEEIGLKPDTETYDGLIQAYGSHRMYDEMGQCVKEIESNGCLPDHVTYNLLIQEFARAGLLTKMESTYQTLLSKKMDLQSSTLIAMLEAYAYFGILDKMEKVYRRVLNSKTFLKEQLIRKLAGVYIENRMLSKLDDLGLDLSSNTGRTDLVWCLRILSHACLLSRKGMHSIVQEMESEKVPWNVTVANIILLSYLKMRDFKRLKVVLSELRARYVKPDIVTVGILFDACTFGFDGTSVKSTWGRLGLFDEAVEMNTDALALTAFGKGNFLRSCKELYSSLEAKDQKKEVWTYRRLINLVFKRNKQLPLIERS